MLLPIPVFFFAILVLTTSHKLDPSDPNSTHLESKSSSYSIDPSDGKLGTLDEVRKCFPIAEAKTLILNFQINAEIPPKDKDGLYYFIITLFVLTVVASTITTGGFLVLSILLWWHFRNVNNFSSRVKVFCLFQMKFFWFLTQLTFSVFVVSTLNLVINIPATLFEMITKGFVTSGDREKSFSENSHFFQTSSS